MTSTAEAVLIAHQRHRGGCLCGWSELGKSLPGHQVKMLAEAGVLVPEPVTSVDDSGVEPELARTASYEPTTP